VLKHFYIQIKIYLLSILHISLQIQYNLNLNLKIRENLNHNHHISSVHGTYLQICYTLVQLFTKLNCEV
jgi:hypothetical protein